MEPLLLPESARLTVPAPPKDTAVFLVSCLVPRTWNHIRSAVLPGLGDNKAENILFFFLRLGHICCLG